MKKSYFACFTIQFHQNLEKLNMLDHAVCCTCITQLPLEWKLPLQLHHFGAREPHFTWVLCLFSVQQLSEASAPSISLCANSNIKMTAQIMFFEDRNHVMEKWINRPPFTLGKNIDNSVTHSGLKFPNFCINFSILGMLLRFTFVVGSARTTATTAGHNLWKT